MDKAPPIIQFIANNPWIVAFASLLGIASFFLSIYFYVSSLKTKKTAYFMLSVTIVSDLKDKASSLIISYLGKEIDCLTITRILFINKGNELIDGSDLKTTDPLRIALKTGLEVFDSKVLYPGKKANEFKIQRHGLDIHIEFDYLDQNQGGIIQIVHTGRAEDLAIDGTIKGISGFDNLEKAWVRDSVLSEFFTFMYVPLTFLFSMYVVLSVPSLLRAFHILILIPLTLSPDQVSLPGFILSLFLTLLLYKNRRNVRISEVLPKEYESVMTSDWKV